MEKAFIWRRPLDDRLRIMIRRQARLWTRFVETRNPQYLKDYKKLRNEVRTETRNLAKKEQREIAIGSASRMQKRSGSM